MVSLSIEKPQNGNRGNKERLEQAILNSTYQFVKDPTKTNGNYQHLFLHPEDCRQAFEEKEKEALAERDFKTRLFFANSAIGPDSVFLQSHFSDNHGHATNFNFLQYFFKSIVATKNWTSARVSLTQLLMAGFLSDESHYCSFAVTMASALSNAGKGTHFEISKESDTAKILQEGNQAEGDIRRQQLCILMNIVFSKFQARRFLLGGGRLNVYRVGHCRSAFADGKIDRFQSYVDSVFCFLLQLCLGVYVVLEMLDILKKTREGEGVWNMANVPLASITFFYSCIVFYADVKDTQEACDKVYHKRTIFQAMDVFVNIALHPLLLVAGVFVIVNQDNFIDRVLNAAALLFIIEVDDNLYTLLNLSTQTIVDNYLVKLSMMQLHMVLEGKLYEVKAATDFRRSGKGPMEENTESTLVSTVDPRAGVDFGDYYLTNQQEQGTDSAKGVIFQPFKLKNDKYSQEMDGPQFGRYFISPSNVISRHCLIKKITWQYTSFRGDLTTSPRIGRLEIELLKQNSKTIIINDEREELGDKVKLRSKKHTLEGVFIITNFQMSTDIRCLRLCGTRAGAKEFVDACEYYSLWDISPSAQKLLNHLIRKEKKNKRKKKEVDHDGNDNDGRIEGKTKRSSSGINDTSKLSYISMNGTVTVHNAGYTDFSGV